MLPQYSWQGDSVNDVVNNVSLIPKNHFGFVDTSLSLYAPGKIGLGYAVGNGTSIVFPHTFNATGNRTFSFWIYIKQVECPVPQTIFYNVWNTGVSSDTYSLQIIDGHFVWSYSDGASYSTITINSVLPTADAWHYILFNYASGNQAIVINHVICFSFYSPINLNLDESLTVGNNDNNEYLVGDCVIDIINSYAGYYDDYGHGNGLELFLPGSGGVLQMPTSASVKQTANIISSANTVASGTAEVVSVYTPLGGVQVSGTAVYSSGIPMDGGVFVKGRARIQKIPAMVGFVEKETPIRSMSQLDLTYNEFGSDGVRASGTALVSHITSSSASGGVVAGGNAIFGLTYGNESPRYEGELQITGESENSFALTYTQSFSWKVQKNVAFEQSFSWNVGDVPLSWYRVEGKCASNTTCDTHGFDLTNGCGYVTYIQVIAARGLKDLCNKLKEGKLTKPVIWPLKSITKRNNPVYTTDGTSSCDVFEEQDFSNIPECLDFLLDETSIFRTSMNFFIQDKFLSHAGSGSIVVSGSAVTSTSGSAIDYHFVSSGGLDTNGSADTSFFAEYDMIVSGGAVCSGEATVVCPNYAYESLVQTIASGTAVVTSSRFSHIASGSVVLDGIAKIGVGLEGSGTIYTGGDAVTSLNLPYIASGSISIDGSADSLSIAYNSVAEGGLDIGGSADYVSSYMGIYVQEITTMDMIIPKVSLGFIEDSLTSTIVPEDTTVNCNCANIPLVLSLTHNLNDTNQMYRFLKRNNLVLPSLVKLNYKELSNMWNCVYHFKGIGEQDANLEKWIVNFNWSCLNDNTSGGYWNLKVNISKENIYTYEKIITRMSFTMPLESFCRTIENKVTVSYNLNTEYVRTDNSFAEVDYFEDNILLFRNKHWTTYPQINLAISDKTSISPDPRYNYAKFFPRISGNIILGTPPNQPAL